MAFLGTNRAPNNDLARGLVQGDPYLICHDLGTALLFDAVFRRRAEQHLEFGQRIGQGYAHPLAALLWLAVTSTGHRGDDTCDLAVSLRDQDGATPVEAGDDRICDYQPEEHDPRPRRFDDLDGHVVVGPEIGPVHRGEGANLAVEVPLEIGL